MISFGKFGREDVLVVGVEGSYLEIIGPHYSLFFQEASLCRSYSCAILILCFMGLHFCLSANPAKIIFILPLIGEIISIFQGVTHIFDLWGLLILSYWYQDYTINLVA